MKNTSSQKLLSILKVLFIALFLSIGVSYINAAWTSAPANPPSSNIDAPINVGSSAQSKTGSLIVNSGSANTYGITAFGQSIFQGFGSGLPVSAVFGSSGQPSTIQVVDGNQASGKVLTSDANGVATWQTVGSGGGGSGSSNIKNTVLTTQSNLTTVAWTDIGLNVTITPATTASKILIQANVSATGGSNSNCDVALYRDGTPAMLLGPIGTDNGSTWIVDSVGLNYLDSPGVTTPVTYRIKVYPDQSNGSGAHCYINRSEGTPSPSAMGPAGVPVLGNYYSSASEVTATQY